MTINKQDLREACLTAESVMVSSFMDDAAEHDFSPAFEAKMDDLRRRKQLRPVKRMMQQAACFALVVLMGGTLWLGTDTEARESFISWAGLQHVTVQSHSPLENANTPSPTDDIMLGYPFMDYVEVHTLSECHQLLQEAKTNPDSDVDPEAIVHCQSSAGTGYYVEKIIDTDKSKEGRSCTHGGEGMIDVRTKTVNAYKEFCTLCTCVNYTSETVYGAWTCKLL